MVKRRSIEVARVKHVNPIPSASRRGPFVCLVQCDLMTVIGKG